MRGKCGLQGLKIGKRKRELAIAATEEIGKKESLNVNENNGSVRANARVLGKMIFDPFSIARSRDLGSRHILSLGGLCLVSRGILLGFDFWLWLPGFSTRLL